MNIKGIAARVTRAAKGYGGVSTAITALFIALLVILNVIIYALATHFSWYLYTTPQYRHRLGGATESYFSDLDTGDAEVRIRFCMTEDALASDTLAEMVHRSALQLAEKCDFVKVDYINIYVEPDQINNYKYGTNAETGEREKINDISTDTVIIDGGAQFRVQTMADFFIINSSKVATAYNGEEVLLSAVHWVLTDPHPAAYFTRNHGETSNSVFYNLLVCAGYEPKVLDLSADDVPDDAAVIVISNPLYDFGSASPGSGIVSEVQRLEAFLAGGGRLIVSLDPLITRTPMLDELLAKWGMERQNATTVRDTNQSLTADGLSLITQFPDAAVADAVSARIAQFSGSPVVLKSASPITLTTPASGGTVEPVLISSPGSKAHADGAVVSDTGSYTLAALSKGASGGSIFLVSSIYLTAQDAIQTNAYANGDFLYALLETTADASVPLGCTILVFDSNLLEGLSMGTVRIWTVLLVAVIPALVFAAGTVIRIRRKNR